MNKKSYIIKIQNSGGLWIQWGPKYKNKKQAEQAVKVLIKKFKRIPWWTSYYRNTTPKIISK